MTLSSVVTLVGGIGLFLLGIHHLTEGLRGLAGDSLRRALQRLASGPVSAVASGAAFTALIQSSTAAILTVIGFVIALAAFSTIFKFAGIAVFFPWIAGFSRLLTRMVPDAGSESAVRHLEPAVAAAGAPVALEAAWRAILEVARGPVDATRRSFAGEPAKYEAPVESVRQIEQFLESLPLETIDLETIGPRLVRLTHALDHLTQLNEDLTRFAPPPHDWQRPSSFDAAAKALAAWLAAAEDPDVPPDPSVYAALEVASNRVTADIKAGREQALEDLALHRAPATEVRVALATLTWSDGALYHTWRLADSIRIASGESMPARTG